MDTLGWICLAGMIFFVLGFFVGVQFGWDGALLWCDRRRSRPLELKVED